MSFRKHFMGNANFTESACKLELRTILAEKPINIDKLVQFTHKTSLPSNYRPLVWKILLGITPRFAESQEYVHSQHIRRYESAFRALRILNLAYPVVRHEPDHNGYLSHGSETIVKFSRRCPDQLIDPKNPEPEHLLLMWLITEARLMRCPELQLNNPENQKYILIGQKLQTLLDDPVDAFHICCSLWSLLRKNEAKIKACVLSAIETLKKKNDILHRHLSCIGLLTDPILENQSLSLFCEVFPESTFEKIIEKILAGSFEVINYLIVALLTQLQGSLFLSNSVENARNVLYQIRKEKADLILKVTLDDYHKYYTAVPCSS